MGAEYLNTIHFVVFPWVSLETTILSTPNKLYMHNTVKRHLDMFTTENICQGKLAGSF